MSKFIDLFNVIYDLLDYVINCRGAFQPGPVR